MLFNVNEALLVAGWNWVCVYCSLLFFIIIYSRILPDQIVKVKNKYPVSEFNEFKPRLKSLKNRFQMSAGLNLEIQFN